MLNALSTNLLNRAARNHEGIPDAMEELSESELRMMGGGGGADWEREILRVYWIPGYVVGGILRDDDRIEMI